MLSVENLSAGYDGAQVLHNVSFTVDKGENIAVIGPNGCGKTTLLRAIINIIPYGGEVFLNGKPVRSIKRKELARSIALLSQITQVYFNYSVYDTVMMGRYAHGTGRLLSEVSSEDRAVVAKALETVHMQEHAKRGVDTLSGGQLQRVFLARTLAQEPEIILLDEPTNHLDLSYQVEFIEFLKSWSSENKKSVVGVLHDINIAARFADKILLMREGRAALFGGTAETLASPVLREVFGMDVSGYMKNALRMWEGIE